MSTVQDRQLGRGLAGEGDRHDALESAGPGDPGDGCLDPGAVAAGLPALEDTGQLGQRPAGLGQGLVQPGRLLGVQGRGVGEQYPPLRAERLHAGLVDGQFAEAFGVDQGASPGRAAEQRRVRCSSPVTWDGTEDH